jgi:hypothetical protein
MDNDDALAYGYMMILLYLIAGVMIWLCWSVVFNMFLGAAINPSIVSGTVSVQTAQATAFNVNVLRYAPPIILMFGFMYGVNRAIFKRGGAS